MEAAVESATVRAWRGATEWDISGRRRLSSRSSACALIPTDDDGQPDGEQSFTSASAAGLSLGGHPGSMFVDKNTTLRYYILL